MLSTELAEGFRIAAGTLWARKLRALLTTLGIVIGIVSVTSMFTVINGIEGAFNRSMSIIGDDALFVQKTPWFAFEEWWKLRNRPPVTDDLVPFLRARSKTAAAVVPLTGTSLTVSRGRDDAEGVGVTGSTAAYVDTGGADIAEGRSFSEAEADAGRAVAVLGSDVVEALFPGEDPIGKPVRIGGQRFEVVGVTVKRGSFLGLQSADNDATIPIRAYRRLFSSDRDIAVKIRVREGVTLDAAEEEIHGLVRIWRGLDPMEDDDFAVNRQDQFRELVSTMRVATYGVGLFLTALSLLVGGIGVMNVMFVSVKERTREIGVRKALGATRRAILLQFLIEAVLICCLGGIIGVSLAAVVALAIDQVFTAELSVGTVALAFLICGVVGVAFGLVPAWQAARARPIDALRYE
ncbi:MAG TPA: ABC transporter permease [Rubricoccaceae bacterium]|jgi:putative ABC transport system permease protein